MQKQCNTTKANLYKGAAQYYELHRTKYPSSLFSTLEQLFQLDGRGRLLDLGCGPGTVAIPMSSRFEEVVAVDADPEMVEVCQEQANLDGRHNIICSHKRSDEIDETFGKFRLVTIARAFHWMNRPAVLQDSYNLLTDDGGIAIVSTDEDPRRGTTDWENVAVGVVKKWLGSSYPEESYGHPSVPHETIVANSMFSSHATHQLAFEQVWTISSYIGYLYSTSFCLRDSLGERARDFEEDLKQKLLSIEPSGQFSQTVGVSLLVASKSSKIEMA